MDADNIKKVASRSGDYRTKWTASPCSPMRTMIFLHRCSDMDWGHKLDHRPGRRGERRFSTASSRSTARIATLGEGVLMRAGKRQAVLTGALTVFARDGYMRASPTDPLPYVPETLSRLLARTAASRFCPSALPISSATEGRPLPGPCLSSAWPPPRCSWSPKLWLAGPILLVTAVPVLFTIAGKLNGGLAALRGQVPRAFREAPIGITILTSLVP